MPEQSKQRLVIASVVALGLVGALVWRATQPTASPEPNPAVAAAAAVVAGAAAPALAAPRPRLVELGSDKCASCKAMSPVLDALRAAHPATLQVDFIDVFKDPEQAEAFKVRIIPSQAFLAPDGRELYRHTGFFSAAAIEAKWAELGFPLTAANAANAATGPTAPAAAAAAR